MRKPLEHLAIQSFVIALSLLNERLPDTFQHELNDIARSGRLETNIERLLNIVEVYPPICTRFRDSRVVEMLRSHSYESLASQPSQPRISLPTTDDWLCLAIATFSAPDSVAELSNLLATDKRFQLIAEYV